MTTAFTEATDTPSSHIGGESRRHGDRIFFAITGIAGAIMVFIIFAIGAFLIVKAIPSLQANTTNFLTTKVFLPEADKPTFGIAALVAGTLLTSAVAMVIAVPVALGVAIFVTQFAPPKVAGFLAGLVDLLAAVPSVVFGLWGLAYLNKHLIGFNAHLHAWLGWIPFFGDTGGHYSKSILLASIVLAIMVLPIVAALSREVILQVPDTQKEAALALGATRWEAVRVAILPASKAGIVSAIMLGFGRALGETIAIALVLGTTPQITLKLLGPAGNTIAANIATTFAEYTDTGRGALIASGLVLFVITFLVNALARGIVIRSARKGQS